METKLCKRCGETKPLSAFGFKKYKRKNGEVGSYPRVHCRPCRHAIEKENLTDEQRKKRNEKAAVMRLERLSRMTDEELVALKTRQRIVANKWRKENPETVKALKKRYREKNSEYLKAKKSHDAKTAHGKELDKQRHKRYIEKHGDRVYAKHKKRRHDLEDWYVASLLTRGKYSGKLIPKELIEAKRAVTLIKRQLKEISK